MSHKITVQRDVVIGDIDETITVTYEFSGHEDYTVLEYIPIALINSSGVCDAS